MLTRGNGVGGGGVNSVLVRVRLRVYVRRVCCRISMHSGWLGCWYACCDRFFGSEHVTLVNHATVCVLVLLFRLCGYKPLPVGSPCC